jgi:8-oxo-dGTP pyrophosphatase MutT (NUDIX family)
MTESFQEYVLVCCTRTVPLSKEPQVLVILKDRPENQKGRINLVGGKVEVGETPEAAAFREVKEETGLTLNSSLQHGIIKDPDFIIHCFSGDLSNPLAPFAPREGETEVPIWMNLSDLFKDRRRMPNLNISIPLLISGVQGWTISGGIYGCDGAINDESFYALNIHLDLK